jgi:hypothetical protein
MNTSSAQRPKEKNPLERPNRTKVGSRTVAGMQMGSKPRRRAEQDEFCSKWKQPERTNHEAEE